MFNINTFYKTKLNKESVITTAVAETWIIKIAFWLDVTLQLKDIQSYFIDCCLFYFALNRIYFY